MKQANKENGEVHTADGKPTASDCGLEPDSSSGLSLSSYSMQNHTRHYRYLIPDMFLSSFIFQPHMTIRWLISTNCLRTYADHPVCHDSPQFYLTYN
jgi:hypothetical protein